MQATNAKFLLLPWKGLFEMWPQKTANNRYKRPQSSLKNTLGKSTAATYQQPIEMFTKYYENFCCSGCLSMDLGILSNSYHNTNRYPGYKTDEEGFAVSLQVLIRYSEKIDRVNSVTLQVFNLNISQLSSERLSDYRPRYQWERWIEKFTSYLEKLHWKIDHLHTANNR